jgi:hypothetical protein
MRKIAFISDLLFAFFLSFVVSLVLFRLLRLAPLLAFLLATLCGGLTTLSYAAFRRSKRKHEFLKKSEERTKEKLLLHLNLSDVERNVEFIKTLLTKQAPDTQIRRIGKNRLSTKTEIYFLYFSFAPVNADNVAEVARLKTNRKKILLCSRAEDAAVTLCKRLHIELQNGEDLFFAVQKADAFPDRFLGNEEEIVGKRPFQLCFSKSNARRFLISGALVLSLSTLTPFTSYYLVFGGILLLAALFTRIFGKE